MRKYVSSILFIWLGILARRLFDFCLRLRWQCVHIAPIPKAFKYRIERISFPIHLVNGKLAIIQGNLRKQGFVDTSFRYPE